MPQGLTSGTTPVKLSGSFDIDVDFENVPNDLMDAIKRTKSHLKTDTFERLVVGRGATDAQAIAHASSIKSLVLSLNQGTKVRPVADEVNTVAIDARDESYILTVPSDGSTAKLVANSTLGLFRGLTTFDTMWFHHEDDKYILNAPLKITDAPAFVSTKNLLFHCRSSDTAVSLSHTAGFRLTRLGTCEFEIFL